MRITMATTPQEVATKTKDIMNQGVIPNMLLKNAGMSNGFVSEKKDYVCITNMNNCKNELRFTHTLCARISLV